MISLSLSNLFIFNKNSLLNFKCYLIVHAPNIFFLHHRNATCRCVCYMYMCMHMLDDHLVSTHLIHLQTWRRSTSDYYTFVSGNLVIWRSKKNVTMRSSTETEYRGMAQGICELL